MGTSVGPLIPIMGFQGAGPVRWGLDMRQVITPQRFGEFEPGQIGPEAVVHTSAEGQHRRSTLARDVEMIGFVVHFRVAVGGRRVGDDTGTVTSLLPDVQGSTGMWEE